MAKKITGTIGFVGNETSNYIQQIFDGTTTHDLAVKNGITFFNGNEGEGVVWDGKQALEVVIPTLADIVSNPVVLKGVIDKAGDVPSSPSNGDLVYIGTPGSYFTPAVACEAGDMAVYYNGAWHVVSGENQVTIKAGTTPASGATEVVLSADAKSVLDVEGKELALKLPTSLLTGVGVTKNADNEISFNEGAVADVDSKWITLSYTAASQDTAIGTNKTIALPSALENGAVTFTGDTALVKPTDIAGAWTAGTNGAHESAQVAVSISGGVTLTAGIGNDFVTGWTPSTDAFVQTAVKSATLKVVASADKSADETIAVNPFVASNPTFTNDSTLFGTAIVTTATGADFTIPGAVSVSAEATKPASDGIVVDVVLPTLGDDASFTDANYATADSSTGVIATIADPTVTINNGNVISSASVSDHVLSFNTVTVTASASQGAVTYKKAQYKKTVVSNTPGVSYGSIQTGAGQGYKLNTQAVNATLTPGAISYIGVQTTDVSAADKANAYVGLTATKGAYTAALSDVAGTIASGAVITSVTDAVVPVLGTVSATGSIAGSVATALSTSNVKVGEFTNDNASVNIGTWALAEGSEGAGAIEVGVGGPAAVTGAITIVSGTYVTEVSGVNLS